MVMAASGSSKLKRTSNGIEEMDRHGWAARMYLAAYGTRLGVRVNDPAVLERLPDHLPPGWEASSDHEVDILYSLVVGGDGSGNGSRRCHRVYAGAAQVACTPDLEQALDTLGSHLELVVASNVTERLFVHAGVVSWRGQAIVMPGRSLTGKTTLLAALLEAGATYYSDEFAIFDRQGWVWPYPRRLCVRDAAGQPARKYTPEELGGQPGVAPVPVGLIVVTEYRPGARWHPRPLSPGRALLALLENTVAARIQPETALATLRQLVLGARAIKSKRAEANQVARHLLNYFPLPRMAT